MAFSEHLVQASEIESIEMVNPLPDSSEWNAFNNQL